MKVERMVAVAVFAAGGLLAGAATAAAEKARGPGSASVVADDKGGAPGAGGVVGPQEKGGVPGTGD